MALFLSIYVIGLVGFFIHVFSLPQKERIKARLIELFLLYQIVFSLGLTSFMAFIGFSFMPQYVAQYLNWPACPFQQEMANVNLSFSILGIMSIWYRGTFWMATVLGFSIWIFADGLHHLYDLFVNQHVSAGNTGVAIYTDFIVPVLLCALLYAYWKTRKTTTVKTKRKSYQELAELE